MLVFQDNIVSKIFWGNRTSNRMPYARFFFKSHDVHIPQIN
jgi:hypothetical protein